MDLACRDEGPVLVAAGAGWAFLHNHAIAHDSEDPRGAAGQSGEPWLRAFAPPLVRASYVDKTGETRLDRDLLLMEVGEGEVLTPSTSSASAAASSTPGASTAARATTCNSTCRWRRRPSAGLTARWKARTRSARPRRRLQATWTMTRSGKEYTYPKTFMGGGVVKTAACEPAVLGKLYDADSRWSTSAPRSWATPANRSSRAIRTRRTTPTASRSSGFRARRRRRRSTRPSMNGIAATSRRSPRRSCEERAADGEGDRHAPARRTSTPRRRRALRQSRATPRGCAGRSSPASRASRGQ